MLRRFCVVSSLLMTAALLGFTPGRASADPVYHFDVTTSYVFNPPSPGAVDTGVVTIANNGGSTFTGTVGVTAVANDGSGDYSTSSNTTLAPGANATLVIPGDSSNVGGFNGSTGATITLNGIVTTPGGCSTPVNLSVSDQDIHSGSSQTSPCDQISTDAFVLQGGSPSGCDNGDTYETSQGAGHFSFVSASPYTFSGFLQPINSDGSSIFKLGSTVPVKFSLSPNPGASLVATLSYAQVSGSIIGDDVEAVSTAAATTGNLFRYDPTSGQYIFNWGTKGLSKGTYQLKITLGDCETFVVLVSLK